jgi:hypothetical protein
LQENFSHIFQKIKIKTRPPPSLPLEKGGGAKTPQIQAPMLTKTCGQPFSVIFTLKGWPQGLKLAKI